MRTVKQLFDEELSGEPLTEESVIEALKIMQKETLEEAANKAEVTFDADILGRRYCINKRSILDLVEK